MTHKRQTIRENAASVLTGLTTTGSNVFASRVYPVESTALPCLLVYIGPEEATEGASMGNTKLIEAELNITVLAAKASGLDDQLDDITEEVQAALSGDRKLSGAVLRRLDYKGIDGPEWSDEGDKDHARMTIQYIATYEVTL